MGISVEFVDELPAPSNRSAAWGKGESRPGRGPLWPDRLAPLVSQPQRWARLKSGGKQKPKEISHKINSGKYAGISAGDFEACVRGTDLYVRYVGGGQ